MRSVSTFLFREGVTDDYFLPRILERALVRLCTTIDVDVAAVVSLPIYGSLVDGVCAAAHEAADGATLFFYHFDGSANRGRETEKYWVPLCERWHADGPDRPLVPVVPVREMEAWAVADLAALEVVAPRQIPLVEIFEHEHLGTPERLSDPKRTLASLFAGTSRRRRKTDPEGYLSRLAEEISIDQLERLPSFDRWRTETTEVLRELRIIR
ncbi:DUF4276 family protein [Cryptosporangium sp. NPDC051539]|uniref:DUF4276 family protein n=1 Tax=Cryptosporangium sp. NPDC051539 TaxID=3363962 RepID=UPI003794D900